jgi:hypothetical protein
MLSSCSRQCIHLLLISICSWRVKQGRRREPQVADSRKCDMDEQKALRQSASQDVVVSVSSSSAWFASNIG